MRRRILLAIVSVAAAAVLLFGVPLAVVIQRFVERDATLELQRQTVLAARDVSATFATNHDPVELPRGAHGASFSLYDADGNLVVGLGPARADVTTARALTNLVASHTSSGRRVVAVPVTADERVVGAVSASQSTAPSVARTRRIIALFAALAVGVVGLAAAIGYVLAGRLARPVRRLRDDAVRLGDGDFTVVVPRSRIPELDDAGRALTATAGRLDELMSRERSFSADASHQLRTPLTGLRAGIETELEFPRDDHTKVLHESLDDIGRLERTITELLRIARSPVAVPPPCSPLQPVLDRLDADWHGRFAEAGRLLQIAGPPEPVWFSGHRTALSTALDVLVDNALVHGAGPARVETSATADSVTLSISDDGAGFAMERVRGVREGVRGSEHGLGLPLAERLVTTMPGRLEIVIPGPRPRIELTLVRVTPPSAPH